MLRTEVHKVSGSGLQALGGLDLGFRALGFRVVGLRFKGFGLIHCRGLAWLGGGIKTGWINRPPFLNPQSKPCSLTPELSTYDPSSA